MSLGFEELDYQKTPLGELILQRRSAVEVDGREIFEVKLNGEYLMSTLFHEGEVALTDLALGGKDGDGWQVVVGGLGLGYTAAAALNYPAVARLVVVEALAPVIDWHQRQLVPNGALLSNDTRCQYRNADFFALASGDGFDPHMPGHRFDAILLDIDHTPSFLLNPSHADFYTEPGLLRVRSFLRPGGVFALWSNELPDDHFLSLLTQVFDRAQGHSVEFPNPIQGGTATNGVYLASIL
ncbi:MAG: spermidine synthase [Verrucomicrobia bacterium]|nr:spermidine synthase [Verrucomicrobiota bacterium]